MDGYKHRKNLDGTWASICMICYLTAATTDTELELIETEAMHSCEGSPRLKAIPHVGDLLHQNKD
jgi:hypothetical protein